MTHVKHPYPRKWLLVVAAVAVSIVTAWLIETAGRAYITGRSNPATPAPNPTQSAASSGLAKVSGIPLFEHPRPVPDISFTDGDDQIRSLADFHGKVVLLNIWATWCVPCRKEMPTLDRLQAKLGGPEFTIVALSIDRAGKRAVEAFYMETDVRSLDIYIDSTGNVSRALAVVGLPTTLLIDAEGRELGRLVGPAEWDAPEMVAFLRSRLRGKSGARMPGSSSDRRYAAALATFPQNADRDTDLDVPVTGNTTSSTGMKGTYQ
jgi:thiol-disulfide isomerase/thioredoxin